jgi:hypothetical protein
VATMNPLRCRMPEDMTVRNLSPATQQSYLGAVTKFSRHFGRPPDRLGIEEVRAYQFHLTSQGIAWASLNQHAEPPKKTLAERGPSIHDAARSCATHLVGRRPGLAR